jgi:hypothetical protein
MVPGIWEQSHVGLMGLEAGRQLSIDEEQSVLIYNIRVVFGTRVGVKMVIVVWKANPGSRLAYLATRRLFETCKSKARPVTYGDMIIDYNDFPELFDS